MAMNPLMLPMLMSMMGKNNGNGNGMDMESMMKMISGMQSGDPSSFMSMLPQNESSSGFMEMAKNLPMLMNAFKGSAQKAEEPKEETRAKTFSADNPFGAVKGFCGNEVNFALNKLFNNK